MKFWRRLISGSMMALSGASCAGQKSPTQIYNQISEFDDKVLPFQVVRLSSQW
ncbi:MAG: hypothetical protein GDA56_19120 [Hormoscilla sp. GM7CHS1pb]|nr:hypothetical protein [Hormoscilla sp. GM7CHS1pb]